MVRPRCSSSCVWFVLLTVATHAALSSTLIAMVVLAAWCACVKRLMSALASCTSYAYGWLGVGRGTRFSSRSVC